MKTIMKRKIISSVLFASLLFSIGCYNTEMVTKEEFKAKAQQVDVTVGTKDSLEYEFSKEHYRIQGDTLSGSGVRVSVNPSARDSVVASISFADITSIETSEFNYSQTGLVVMGLLIVGALGVILIAMSNNPI